MRGAWTSLLLSVALLPACGDEPGPGGERGAPPARADLPADDGSGDPGGTRSPSRATGQGAGSGAAPDDEPWFEEVAEARGLRFRHVSGHRGPFLMPEIMGGGAALFDADGDGDLDAYLVQGGFLGESAEAPPPNQLFVNDGRGHFSDATAGSGAGDTGYGMGVACGDVDGDGDTDLHVTNLGTDALLLNDGRGRFTDATATAGVQTPGWGTSAAFADLDGDGQLDLYVAQYLEWSADGELTCRNHSGKRDYCDPANYGSPARDALYRNLGDGRFEDVTSASGIGSVARTGLGVVCGDLDGDGRVDVFVANDGMPDLLWRNDGGLRFTDVALVAGCAVDNSGQAKAGMGVALADLDDDLDLDLLVCNLDRQTDSLFVNEGGRFSDRTARTGLAAASRPFTRFGVGIVDLDHDGRLDLFQANGRVSMAASPPAADPYAEPNLVLAGAAEGRFVPLATSDGTRRPLVATSRAAAFGDVDGDGALDVLVANRDGPAHLYRNLAGARPAPDRQWIGFRVVAASGGDALGAVVLGRAGGRRLRGDVRAASSYQASNDPRVHLGLGASPGLDEVTVRWPDGVEESFGSREGGRWHLLRRGEGGP